MNTSSIGERYFNYLGTQYKRDDGTTRQPAAGNFIDALKRVQESYRPKFDLTKCLAGMQEGFYGKVWFWSDLHINHANIIRYCERPFTTVDDMRETFLRSCQEVVGKEDILILGGDIGFAKSSQVNATLREFGGYRIGILGNHDTNRREIVKLAVDELAPYLEFEYQGRSFFLSHYPVPEGVLEPEQFNIHGHIHNTPLHPAMGDGTRHINISVECTNYRPVSLDWLLEKNKSAV